MISEKTLSKDWLFYIKNKHKKADIILIEKVIRAMKLTEALRLSGIDFIFKGGTAIILYEKSVRRFSIDVDIVVEEKTTYENFFKKVISLSSFTEYKEDKRTESSKIKKRHYKFFYKPVYKTNLEKDYILLDVVEEKNLYQELNELNIDMEFLVQEGDPVKVRVPSREDLFADKLTAFAPHTIGIPYEKGGVFRGKEIIKQLFDLGNLFEKINDIEKIKRSFYTLSEKEIEYRDFNGGVEDIKEDIFKTSLCISTRGKYGKCDFKKIEKGITNFKAFVINKRYNIEKAIVDSSKVAYILKTMKRGRKEKIKHFKSISDINDITIEKENYRILNKLKKVNPEAFFYWHLAIESRD